MKFLRPKSGQSIDLFRMFAQQEGYTLSNPEGTEKFISNFSEEFTKAKNNPIMLHGFRVQAMFEYVASSLGECAIIKTEDVGGLHTAEPDVKVPDLRILLIDGYEFFVEIKNFYQSSPFELFRIKKNYIKGLQHYAALFKKDVKLAIYWSRWNQWTLVTLDRIKCNGNKCSLSFEDAMKSNEMAILGDFTLATLPPLKLRIITDPSHTRTVSENGKAIFRIDGVELYCNDNLISDPQEKDIAFFLMLYGEWNSSEGAAHIEENEIIHLDFTSQPIETHDEQIFEMIGNMSGIISRRYNSMTSNEYGIERISPKTDISNLGIKIPDDYQGKVLHLWRFTLHPSTD
ncbi:MAG: hypothetical protein WAW61_15820 [Methylococcaceae bacterium]